MRIPYVSEFNSGRPCSAVVSSFRKIWATNQDPGSSITKHAILVKLNDPLALPTSTKGLVEMLIPIVLHD